MGDNDVFNWRAIPGVFFGSWVGDPIACIKKEQEKLGSSRRLSDSHSLVGQELAEGKEIQKEEHWSTVNRKKRSSTEKEDWEKVKAPSWKFKGEVYISKAEKNKFVQAFTEDTGSAKKIPKAKKKPMTEAKEKPQRVPKLEEFVKLEDAKGHRERVPKMPKMAKESEENWDALPPAPSYLTTLAEKGVSQVTVWDESKMSKNNGLQAFAEVSAEEMSEILEPEPVVNRVTVEEIKPVCFSDWSAVKPQIMEESIFKEEDFPELGSKGHRERVVVMPKMLKMPKMSKQSKKKAGAKGAPAPTTLDEVRILVSWL